MLSTVTFSACHDDDESPTCVAGTGGNVTLVLFPKHHGKAITNKPTYPDTAYIKFNTLESPVIDTINHIPTSYDAIFVGDAGHDHIHCEGLKCGKYYIWVTGFDTSSTVQAKVFGGFSRNVTEESGEIDIDVAVTEGD